MDARRTLPLNINMVICFKAKISPMLENNNLSYTAQNHSSKTILTHFVYRWQMNITAEF